MTSLQVLSTLIPIDRSTAIRSSLYLATCYSLLTKRNTHWLLYLLQQVYWKSWKLSFTHRDTETLRWQSAPASPGESGGRWCSRQTGLCPGSPSPLRWSWWSLTSAWGLCKGGDVNTRSLPRSCSSSHVGPFQYWPGGVEDVCHGDVAVVFDVLHLLAVTVRLLQGLDDQGGGGGADGDLEETQWELEVTLQVTSPEPVCSALSTGRWSSDPSSPRWPSWCPRRSSWGRVRGDPPWVRGRTWLPSLLPPRGTWSLGSHWDQTWEAWLWLLALKNDKFRSIQRKRWINLFN